MPVSPVTIYDGRMRTFPSARPALILALVGLGVFGTAACSPDNSRRRGGGGGGQSQNDNGRDEQSPWGEDQGGAEGLDECPEGHERADGECLPSEGEPGCPEGHEWADGECLPIQGVQECPEGHEWADGECLPRQGVQDCPEGQEWADGECLPSAGEQGCPEGQEPVDGQCQPSGPRCDAPLTSCGDVCVDITANNLHCGGCDQECGDGWGGPMQCVCSECIVQCQCGGCRICDCACVEPTDTAHCGECGNACDAGEICAGGQCWGDDLSIWSGLRQDIDTRTLSGFTRCYDESYQDTGDRIEDIFEACSGPRLIMGCAARTEHANPATLTVAFQASRERIAEVASAADGVNYYRTERTWGFAPRGLPVDHAICDQAADWANQLQPELRMCWRVLDGTMQPGSRCGTQDDLIIDDRHHRARKVFFHLTSP